jgi:hypothetical protein
MRKALTTLAILLVACLQVARADVKPNAAPADEYFGPYSQSVLEIRNRLDDYDKIDNRAMLEPSVGGYLDHLQLAIRDWQHKYPADPWLPRILAHLMREYWRAGQASSEHGTAALAFMRAAYPDAAETTATISMIYGSNVALSTIARDTQAEEAPPPQADVDAAAPPPYGDAVAPPPYETPASYQTLPSYATANQGTPTSDVAANEVAAGDATQAPDDTQAADPSAPADDAPTPPPTR